MDVVIDNLPRSSTASESPSSCSSVSGVAALILGTIIAAMRISPVAALRGFARV